MESVPAPCNNLEAFLDGLLRRIEGLTDIYIHDKLGIPMLQVSTQAKTEEESNFSNRVSTAFAIHLEQTEKMQFLGDLKYVLACQSNGYLLQLNVSPLIVTFYANEKVNIGELLEILPACKAALEVVRTAVESIPEVEMG
ncbi:putative Ragulator complex protein LAMTOR3-A [Cardiosporidium cionae]|uniref:Ragulator complex protein LAMTOR3-A n=1 Tax=Cardiosporidium cionae TaxID=476202 RepID=A0ABQ7JC99_9APIC|nr:putative Ragulator complex protein LAMTOR3-A [Cardiosporidium cionae]|eukprot:KAF8821275.1 putative Ragulator complex protein LAMTOR3-A [Cardiosporidium cionae]